MGMVLNVFQFFGEYFSSFFELDLNFFLVIEPGRVAGTLGVCFPGVLTACACNQHWHLWTHTCVKVALLSNNKHQCRPGARWCCECCRTLQELSRANPPAGDGQGSVSAGST